MSTPSELQDFHRFLGERIQSGAPDRSPEEILEEWRSEHEVIQAVRDALHDMAAGDTGVPYEDVERQIRARYGLQPRAS